MPLLAARAVGEHRVQCRRVGPLARREHRIVGLAAREPAGADVQEHRRVRLLEQTPEVVPDRRRGRGPGGRLRAREQHTPRAASTDDALQLGQCRVVLAHVDLADGPRAVVGTLRPVDHVVVVATARGERLRRVQPELAQRRCSGTAVAGGCPWCRARRHDHRGENEPSALMPLIVHVSVRAWSRAARSASLPTYSRR